MPPAVVAAVVSTGATAVFAGNFTVGFLAQTFIKSAVINFALQALAPKPSIPNIGGSFQQSHTVTTRQSNASRKIVYGETRVGGPFGFIKTADGDSKIGMTILLSVGEVQSIKSIFFDTELLSLDVNGKITAPNKFKSGNSKIRKFTGSSSQAAPDIDFRNRYVYPDNATLTDVAYIAVDLEKTDDDSYPNGVPNITAIVEGRKCFDPRTSTTIHTHNPAVIIRDYLLDADYGLGVSSSEINDTSFIAAASICDETVPLSGGGVERRYTFNGVIDTANTPKSNLEQMLTSMAGTLYYSNGKWSIKAGAYVTPTVTLDEDDLAGPIQINTAVSRRDAFNAVKGQFISPNSKYQATDYPAITNSTFETEDGGQRSYLDFALPFTQSSKTAQRLAKIALFKNRQRISLSAKFKLTAFQFEVGDTLMITNTRLGFSSKVFEVQAWALNFTAEEVTVDCQLMETNSDVYSWNAEEEAFEQDNTTLPDPFDLVAPSFTATDEVRALNQTAISVLIVAVASPSIYAKNFEVQAKKTTDSEYTSLGIGAGNKFELLDVEDGVTYDIRARIINRLGVQSPYRTGQHQIVGKTAPPQDVTGFSVNIIDTEAHLSWTPVTDADLSHYHVRHARETSGATYTNSIDLAPKVSRPANTVIVPAMTGTYFIRAVDKLGNASTNATSKVAIIEDFKGLNAVATSTQHPTFSGTKSGVVVVDNTLKLKSTIKFEDLTGNFDDVEGLFDGASGNTGTSGTYDFDNYVDLGAVYTSRVTATVNVSRSEYATLFDTREGLFDDAVGTFDGDVQAFDDTNVELQIGVTEDDPTITPETGLTLSASYAARQSHIIAATPGAQNHVFAADVILPSVVTEPQCLYEAGGSGSGHWIGFESTTNFRMRFGRGNNETPATDKVILDIPVANLPMDDGLHTLVWEIGQTTGTARVFVDGELVGSTTTVGYNNSIWTGNNEANFIGDDSGGDHVNVTVDDPHTAWTYGFSGSLRRYTNQTVTATLPTYTEYAPFFVGDYKARGLRFRALLTSSDEQASPVVSALSVTVDMPDRTIAVADTASGAGAKAITFSPAFKGLQGIGITAQNLNSGDYYAITAKSATGFTITFFNSSNVAVDRTFDFVAKGFGEVAA